MPKKTYIELFAGCGGLSLGLESEGLELYFANELSPMAAETFAFNILNEDLQEIAKDNDNLVPEKTLWLNSRYRRDAISERLKENPLDPPRQVSRHDERPLSANDIVGRLLVGSIIDLNDHLELNPSLRDEIRNAQIDVISGGPPCQSFSMAGLRQHSNNRNTLPWEFARFVNLVKPKIAVLENVTGILRAFTIPTDSKQTLYHAWHEVAKAFAQQNYVPICLHVNAKYAGVAQNRPRFIMVSIQKEYFETLESDDNLEMVFENSWSFFKKANKAPTISLEDSRLEYWDIEKTPAIFESGLLSPFLQYQDSNSKMDTKSDWHTVQEAINDFAHKPSENISSRYVDLLNQKFQKLNRRNEAVNPKNSKNQNHRSNTLKVRQRFRVYQIIERIRKTDPTLAKEVFGLIKNPTLNLSGRAQATLLVYRFLQNSQRKPAGVLKKFKTTENVEMVEHIKSLTTKKQTQRALIANLPAPAALSIPDDGCHYSEEAEDIRTLSVREMARIQSFPDWFEFRSKETTGGQMRKFQVPQYTQVGNAVPPLLGKAIGKVVNSFLKKFEVNAEK